MASHGGSGSTEKHLVDELEAAFKACLASLVAQETVHVYDQIEQKTSVEQSTHRFLELARETESFFLQRQLLMATTKPDNVIKEEIDELKAELSRKNALLQKQQTKVNNWLSNLQSMEGGGGPAQPQHLQQQPQQQQQHPQQQQLQHLAQMQQQQHQQQHHPQQLARGTMSMSMGGSGSMQQQQGGMDLQGQAHVVQMAGGGGGDGTPGLMTAPLSGPLAHLEQATSSIGGSSYDRR